MSRPRVICHMHPMLNGKVDGLANITGLGMKAQRVFFDLMLGENRYLSKNWGWLVGRGTVQANLGRSAGT